MSEPKTRPGPQDPKAFVEAIVDPARRALCQALLDMMGRATQSPPVVWGGNIVGFGSYHCVYASGREGDWPRIGFAPRKREVVVYLIDGFADHAELLARLGRHKVGKSCLYLPRAEQVDLKVLEALIGASVRQMAQRHPAAGA